MTVQFSTTMGPIAGFAFTCGHSNGLTGHRFDTYEDAVAFRQTEIDTHGHAGGLAVCGDTDDCGQAIMFVQAVETDPAPSFSASGTNTAHLLRLLDLPSAPNEDGGFFGSMPARDFLDRVQAAEARTGASPAPRPAAPAIHVGRYPGYAEGRLEDLRAIAEFGVSHDRPVQWAG
jgi:hypothetical protein